MALLPPPDIERQRLRYELQAHVRVGLGVWLRAMSLTIPSDIEPMGISTAELSAK